MKINKKLKRVSSFSLNNTQIKNLLSITYGSDKLSWSTSERQSPILTADKIIVDDDTMSFFIGKDIYVIGFEKE